MAKYRNKETGLIRDICEFKGGTVRLLRGIHYDYLGNCFYYFNDTSMYSNPTERVVKGDFILYKDYALNQVGTHMKKEQLDRYWELVTDDVDRASKFDLRQFCRSL